MKTKTELLRAVKDACDTFASSVGNLPPYEAHEQRIYTSEIRTALNKIIKSLSAAEVRQILA